MEDDRPQEAAASAAAATTLARSKSARNSKKRRHDDETAGKEAQADSSMEERKQSSMQDEEAPDATAAAAVPPSSSSAAAAAPSPSSRSRKKHSKKQKLPIAPAVVTIAPATSMARPLFAGLNLDALSSVFSFLNTRDFLLSIRVSRYWRAARVKKSAWPALQVPSLIHALQHDDYDNPARRRLHLDIGRHPYTPTLKKLQSNPGSLAAWRLATAAHVTHKRTTGTRPSTKDLQVGMEAMREIISHFQSISALTLHDAAAEDEAVKEFYRASTGEEWTATSSSSSSAAAASSSSSAAAAAPASGAPVRRAALQAVLLARCSPPFLDHLPVLSSSLRVLVLDCVPPDTVLKELVNLSYLHMEIPASQFDEHAALHPLLGRALRYLSTVHALRSLSLNVARSNGSESCLTGLPMLILSHEPTSAKEWGFPEDVDAAKLEEFVSDANKCPWFKDWSQPSALEALSITGKLSAQADRVVLSDLLAGFAHLPSLRRLNWLQVNSLYDPFAQMMLMLQMGFMAGHIPPQDLGTPLLPDKGVEQPVHLRERLKALEALTIKFVETASEPTLDLSARVAHLEVCEKLRSVHLGLRISSFGCMSTELTPLPAALIQRLFAAWSGTIEEIRLDPAMEVNWEEPEPAPEPKQKGRGKKKEAASGAAAKGKGRGKAGAAAAAAAVSSIPADTDAAAASGAASSSAVASSATPALTIDPTWSSLSRCVHLRVLELPQSMFIPDGFLVALSSLPHFRSLELSWIEPEQPCQPNRSILCAMLQSRSWRTLRFICESGEAAPDYLQVVHPCGLQRQLERLQTNSPPPAEIADAVDAAIGDVRVFGHSETDSMRIRGYRIATHARTGRHEWIEMSKEEVDNEA